MKDFEAFNFPGSNELAAMFEFYQHGGAVRDVKLTKRLYPHVRTFDRWLHDEWEELDKMLKDDEEDDT